MSGMREIDGIRLRLESAGELPELLEAAWDAFSLILAVCQECEGRSAELFAAYAFAASAAATGRRMLVVAPSLPPGWGDATGYEAIVRSDDLEGIGEGLADLADLLGARLSSAARQAGEPGGRQACQGAAAEAARIGELLAWERR